MRRVDSKGLAIRRQLRRLLPCTSTIVDSFACCEPKGEVTPKGQRGMKFHRIQSASLALAWAFLFAGSAAAQAPSSGAPKSAVEQRGFTWTETYEGSGNTDGFITDLNSTIGYIFNAHLSMHTGVPYLFVRPSTSKTGTTAVSGFGNPYVGLTYTDKGPIVDFATSLNGAVPVASSAKGFSTGRATFDWNNHFDHGFDLLTPFLDLGVANSISDTRYLHRPYISLGKLAHFEGGGELDLGDKFSISASGYYILPWGPQKIFKRGKKGSSGSISGGPSLTRDDGVNLGLDYNLTRFMDLNAGYSYSAYSVLNTFSFGIEFNLAGSLKKHHRE